MELYELKQAILDNKIPNFLIFTGEEGKLIDIYIEKIAEVKKVELKSIDDVTFYLNMNSQKNLFKQDISYAVIRNDTSILQKEDQWAMLPKVKNTLVLTFTKIDKTTKFYKHFKDYIVSFDRMNPEHIKASLMKKLQDNNMKIQQKYIDWLVSNCSNDYGRCINELDKILIFKNDPRNCEELFKQFARDNAFHYDIPDCIFDFSNAFILRNKEKVWNIYEDLKQTSDGPLVVFTVLYNSFKNILLVQSANKPTADTLGMSPKQFNAIKFKVGKYSTKELSDIILLISELDRKIKLGLVEDRMALEYFMVKVL